MANIDIVAAENNAIIEALRPVTAADVGEIHGMGLSTGQWKDIHAEPLLPYLCVHPASKEAFFTGYLAAQFVGDECVHLSIALGERDKIEILEGQTQLDGPSVYNVTRGIGRLIINACSTTVQETTQLDPSALPCLERLIPGIPGGDPKEDKGLHMSLFNKPPGAPMKSPAAADVKEMQKKFEKGIAIQMNLADFTIVKGLRCNDMSTGGLYYLACGMSPNMATLCRLIKEQFSDTIRGYASHVSLELLGVAGCRHSQQKLADGPDLKYWFCDYLRWGIEAADFAKCLDEDGNFDIALYMYVRTQARVGDISAADKAAVAETLELMGNFSPDATDKFIKMVDGHTGFGFINPQQRLHKKDSSVYTFFEHAVPHAGLDCALSMIKNCAVSAGKGPSWYPGTGLSLPPTDVQWQIQKYIASFHGAKLSPE